MSQSGGSSTGALCDESNATFHFPTDLVSPQDRKEEALTFLKTDVMEALEKEVKSLDEDSWKFAGPRSQIHLISRPDPVFGVWNLTQIHHRKVPPMIFEA